MRRIASVAGALALGLGGLSAAGCDKVPLLAPTESTVTVTAGTKVLPVGGSAEVTAFVAESSGTPVQNGTVVRFNTNLGRVDPVEAQTKNGLAVTTFQAGDVSGVADVRATSGSAGGSTATGATATNVVQISVGAAAVESVTLSANPGSVPAGGGTVQLVAVVLGASGGVLSGVPVTFVNTEGQLGAARVVSDASGEAKTSLTTDRTSSVTATAGSKTSTAVTITRRDPIVTPSATLVATGETATPTAQRWVFTVTLSPAAADLDATVRPVEFEWQFGDGNSVKTNGGATAHIYTAENQVRQVTVKVTLANGQIITAVTEIVVADFP